MIEELKALVAEQLSVEVDTLSADSNFVEDLGADSLDLFEVAMAMEEKYNIEIPSEDLQDIKTIGDAEKYINAKLGE